MPEVRPTLEEARLWCKQLAGSHYENFHVATMFLPKEQRPHFESIYAYCRVSDDLGDEVADQRTTLRLLDAWEELLNEAYDRPQESMHPVFVALQATIAQFSIPRTLFADLLKAFRQDQVLTHYETWEELLEYSRNSANPVGRLVLCVSGYRQEEICELSDKVCTGLQLANFWQDVVEDAERGRRYIPAEWMERFGVEDGQILGRVFTPQFREMAKDLVERTRRMLEEGSAITTKVDADLAVTLTLFCKGGKAILSEIAKQDYDVLRGRPVVSKLKKAGLLLGAMGQKYGWGGRSRVVAG